jgi:hypothetical protein
MVKWSENTALGVYAQDYGYGYEFEFEFEFEFENGK